MKFLFYVLCTVLLFVASFQIAYAQVITLPQTFRHDGLIFTQALQISSPSIHTLSVTFGDIPTLAVKKTKQKEVLAEQIVAPTITKSIVPTSALIPTFTPTPIIKPTATPTQTPSPTTTSQPIPAEPTVASLSTPGGLDAEKLFTMSNEFRASRGLPALQKHEKSCQLAASRAPEIAGEVASGDLHAGLRARNLDYWNSENIISMRTEEAAFNWWVNDKIHHDAIVGNYTYSCVACHGNSCAQEFTNFQPK